MKNKSFLFVTSVILLITACNNNAPDRPGNNAVVRTKADTLLEEIDDGHIAGMGKMGKLTRAEQEVTRLLDSVNKLPAKIRQAASPYRQTLESLQVDLKQADSSMNKWMNEFKIDSAAKNLEERIKYLGSEKDKITEVKKSILGSLQKADSVLKRKI